MFPQWTFGKVEREFCHHSWVGSAVGISWGRNAANYLSVDRIVPQTKNFSAPNIGGAEVEKP